MSLSKPIFLLVIIYLLGNVGFVLAQDTKSPLIFNSDTEPIHYCSDSILVAPHIQIRNITIDEASEGMKVSIVNYKRGEDVLVWNAVHGFRYIWNNNSGQVEITGVGTAEQYQEAIANVYYKNLETEPTLGVRSFSISLLDADYLPATQHFYRFVSVQGISWTDARDSAANMKYFGLQGYLATVGSTIESDFILSKTTGTGWIGASDQESEGVWKWVVGPEKGTVFWRGNANGTRVAGEYSNWGGGEPNNQGNEDYAHVLYHIQTAKGKWNDLPNAGTGGDYEPKGFLVEFGGMPGDPTVKLSAEASVQVSKIAFSDEREFDICPGELQSLNLEADGAYSYSWTPAEYINDPTLSNPVVYPQTTTIYTAVGTLDLCTDTARFFVNVHPAPESILPSDTTICKGNSVTLDPGIHSSYLWSTGETSRTISVADEGKYWVQLTNDIPCTVVDTVNVKWSVRPELDYSTVDTLVCGGKSQTLTLSFTGRETASTVLRAMDANNANVLNGASLNPTLEVSEFGRYSFEMILTDVWGCEFMDTLNVEFHNQPEAILVMDEEECKGYNLELSFGGKTEEDALFTWFYNDSVFQEGVNLENVIVPLGYGQLNRRVGLTVNEKGCMDTSEQVVTVTPNVNLLSGDTEGCHILDVEFEAKSTEEASSYLWDFGDGVTSAEKNPSHKFVNNETIDSYFDVKLTVVSTEGCENTGTIENMVVLHPKPSVNLSFDEADCNSEKMEIWYQGSGNERDTYFWDLKAFKADEIVKNPLGTKGPLEIHRYSEPTASIGIHVVSEYNCSSDTITKLWKRKPVFEVTIDSNEGCPPLPVSIQANVLDDFDEVLFDYNLGDGTSGSGNFVEHTYKDANSEHRVHFFGKSSLTGCEQDVILEDSVFVFPVPEAAFSPVPPVVIISDPVVVFENTSMGAEYFEWDFGDDFGVSYDISPEYPYQKMGFFQVLLAAYNRYDCKDTVSAQVIVAFDKIFPPNAFSPNAEKEEDREFRLHSEGLADEGYNLMIFNRWGEKIFQSTSQEIGWDGRMKNGKYAPVGVYTWTLEYQDFRGEVHKQQGVVNLLF